MTSEQRLIPVGTELISPPVLIRGKTAFNVLMDILKNMRIEHNVKYYFPTDVYELLEIV